MLITTKNEQANTFNRKLRTTKSLMSLSGILKGLVADQKLNEQELLFLSSWLINNRDLPDDGDVLDLLCSIDSILDDGAISKDELDDLMAQIEDIVDYSDVNPNNLEDLANQLLGFLSGITADGKVTEDEVIGLIEWLNANNAAFDCWPGNVLHKKLNEILADNFIDNDELEQFTETCKLIAGQRFMETGISEGLTTEFCTMDIEAIPESALSICFTGKFISGSRAFHHNIAEKLGLTPIKDVTQSLDLLVLGGIASPDWRFSSHGRKIEKAIQNQQKGCGTIIVNEETWLKVCE